MTSADDLVTWLRARLDEDERVARAAERFWHGIRIESATEAEEDHARCWDPARVLAEVDAKRRVLTQYDGVVEQVRHPVSAENRSAARIAQGEVGDVIRLLALPYADRPGYREEWKLT